MSSPRTYLMIALLALSLGATFAVLSRQAMGEEKSRTVPKASCGPQERTESGLQGQTTLAERFASGPAKTYHCNLELVSRFEDEGNAGFMQVLDGCVYSATWQNAKMRHPGVMVLDVSDSRYPKATGYLDSPAMLNPNQSLRVDPARKLLFANQFNKSTFDIYDLSPDCSHPILKNSVSIPGMMAHFIQLTADGQTLYGSSCCEGFKQYPLESGIPPAALFAIDTSDPLNPRGITTWTPPREWSTHGVSLNKDGTRAYATIGRKSGDHMESGLLILDISDIQARRPNAQFRSVGSLFWDDTFAGELAQPLMIKGRPYLVVTDLLGAITGSGNSPLIDACASGKPGHGFARIIDISDEKNPKTVSKLMLEVHDPANCAQVKHDPVTRLGYGSFFCDADDADHARMLACGYAEAGLRVFDIRDPGRPREIAYYKPPAPRTHIHPGSVVRNLWPEPQDQTADKVWFPVFRKNGQEIWFVSSGSGFHVVRFTDRFKASNPELF